MSTTQEPQHDIDMLLSDAGDFIETRTTLWKLKAIESLSDVSGELVSGLALIGILSMAVLILSTGLALLIGYWTGRSFFGFFIIGGAYAIIGLVIYAFRNHWLKEPFSNMLIRKILK
jgi:hypothetical protein